MNGALIGLWLAVAVGACGFTGGAAPDAPIGEDADREPPDASPDSSSSDAPPLDGAPDASLCTPNATSCNGRVLSTCSADGSTLTTTTCDLACTDGACFSASNLSSAIQQQCTSAAPAITIANSETATIDRALVPVLNAGGMVVPSTVIPSAGLEPAIAVFCLSSLEIDGGARLVETGNGDSNAAIVLLVTGNVTIAGQLRVDGRAASALTGGRGGMGGFAGANAENDAGGQVGSGPCAGRGGVRNTQAAAAAAGGGGGGGNGGLGGKGGQGYGGNASGIPLLIGPGGAGGMACTSQALTPLVGGSGGGSGADGTCATQCGHAGGGGGGALQISAGGAVSIIGVVSAEGGAGFAVGMDIDFKSATGGGGGSGGSILVEAPSVSIGAGTLRVAGGNGGASQAGAGGAGASTMLGGVDGTDSSTAARNGGAGGGGAAGRVRINTPGATPCGQAAAPAGACTSGPLASQP